MNKTITCHNNAIFTLQLHYFALWKRSKCVHLRTVIEVSLVRCSIRRVSARMMRSAFELLEECMLMCHHDGAVSGASLPASSCWPSSSVEHSASSQRRELRERQAEKSTMERREEEGGALHEWDQTAYLSPCVPRYIVGCSLGRTIDRPIRNRRGE